MKITKKELLSGIIAAVSITFATPAHPLLCLLAFAFGYPALFIYFYKIESKKRGAW